MLSLLMAREDSILNMLASSQVDSHVIKWASPFQQLDSNVAQ